MNTNETDISGPDVLLREYDLVGERKQEPHYYEIQTELALEVWRDHARVQGAWSGKWPAMRNPRF